MENNTKSLEDILCKMLPSIVKKDNEWYQDGFLYIRFLNDYIQVKVGKSEYAEKVVNITNDEESLYSYLKYFKNFTSTGKVNNLLLKETKNSKECENKYKANVNGALCKNKCEKCSKL